MALAAGRPRYVTVLAETDTPAGWRPTKATSGCVLDVASGATVARGLAMAHSPRVHNDQLWALDPGRGRLVQIDPQAGCIELVAEVPGYTRGLAFQGTYAFVGLSKIRETAVFGGLPIAEQKVSLQCGVQVVDLRSGRVVAGLAFQSGVDEIFDVQILTGVRCPVISGPFADIDGGQAIWLAPPPSASPASFYLLDSKSSRG